MLPSLVRTVGRTLGRTLVGVRGSWEMRGPPWRASSSSISIEKVDKTPTLLWPPWALWPRSQIAFPLGFGPLFRPDPLARSPSRSGQGHFSAQDGPGPPTKVPRAAQDRQHRPQERHKTANKGPESGQDRPHRPQEQPKTANIAPKSGPKTAQDRQQRPQDRPKTANIGAKTGPRPPT